VCPSHQWRLRFGQPGVSAAVTTYRGSYKNVWLCIDTRTPLSMQSSAGRSFGLYQIIEPIGAGGMGEVFKARDSHLSSRSRPPKTSSATGSQANLAPRRRN
jgi:hypothetical protein